MGCAGDGRTVEVLTDADVPMLAIPDLSPLRSASVM